MSFEIFPSRILTPPPRRPFLTFETVPDKENGGLVTNPIVNVPLQNGYIAQCLLQLFNMLMRGGAGDQWFWHHNGSKNFYVRTVHCKWPGKLMTVARLIAEAGPRTQVRYIDGNPLNLRLSNLRVGSGFSKGFEKAAQKSGDEDGTY